MNTRRVGRAVVTAALAITFAAPAAASAASPLAGWWPMNERSGQTVYDWSGNGNHGRLGSTPGADDNDPTWIRGVFNLGSALRFDGNDFITIPDSASLRPAQLTVSAWFRGERTPGSFRYLVAKGADGCEASSYALYTSASEGLGFYVYDGTAWKRSPEAGPSVWDGRWHHAAGTYDGQMLRLFVDGVEVGSGTPATLAIDYDLPVTDSTLGTYGGTCALHLVGDIDGVSIWNRALPVADIARVVRAFIGGR
ncbi:MAG TPA: LamG domain-containing protein [Solirubrobacteraceae bacterium]|nr:LamG domain-containing protein [Solirubrobacteraceae bacterium]